MLRSLPFRSAAAAPRPASRPARVPAPAVPTAAPSARRSVAAAAAQGASTVRVSVQGRHLEVTDALKAYAVSEMGGGAGRGRGGVTGRREGWEVASARRRAMWERARDWPVACRPAPPRTPCVSGHCH